MMCCQIVLQSPPLAAEERYWTTEPGSRDLPVLLGRGWTVVRVFRASLPWPPQQRITGCVDGHRPPARTLRTGRG